jgi:hypothetical protein
LVFAFGIVANFDTPKNYHIHFSSKGESLPNESIGPVVERCYVPCLCCSWLILEGNLHLCWCGAVHTPEQSYGEKMPPDDEEEVYESRPL